MTLDETFGPYLERYGPALSETFGVTPEIIPTGGNCFALEMRLETVTVWITDDGEPLSPWAWRQRASEDVTAGRVTEYFGLSVTVHRGDDCEDLGGVCGDGGPIPEPATVVQLVKDALDDARTGGTNMYGPHGLAGDRIARGFNDESGE